MDPEKKTASSDINWLPSWRIHVIILTPLPLPQFQTSHCMVRQMRAPLRGPKFLPNHVRGSLPDTHQWCKCHGHRSVRGIKTELLDKMMHLLFISANTTTEKHRVEDSAGKV